MEHDPRFQSRIIAVLRASKIFGQLDALVLADLAHVLALQGVHGGQVVVREGDVADSMLFVISGALRVSRRDRSGRLLLYNEVRPGASFGEAGLILQQPRAADVTATRDSVLAVLTRNHFELLLNKHPIALNKVFVQAIYNYLRHDAQEKVPTAETIVVVPLSSSVDIHCVARDLTKALGRTGRAYHQYASSQSDPVSANAHSHDEVVRNDELEREYDFVVHEAQVEPSAWTRRAYRQADQIVFVVDAESPKSIGILESALMQEPGFYMKRRHLLVTYGENTVLPDPTSAWRIGRDIERVYPTRTRNTGDFDRLARFLTGNAVGIVLGGGGARGFAHLGVLRALERSGIPVDLIGGNSMGALIGAQYACDVPLDEIRLNTQRFALGGERPTLPLISLVSGKRVKRDLIKMFGDVQVDALWRPFFAAACNLTKGITTVQESGHLWRAVLASNSPAGLFPPVIHHGDLLVDGAILENVPVGAMRQRLGIAEEKRRGNGTIIAVDVDVQEELSVPANVNQLSVWSALRGLFPGFQSRMPGIGEILYRAGHIGGLSQRGKTIAQSDHYLEPPVSGYSMMGYRNSGEIVEVGYRYAMEKIEGWGK
jgi:predicted acylesterase/phospholipase RssA